ncbi:hypothetical protein [Cellulomonas sp. ES6]|uniref:hypothetical protein n=1 Tax=Cellulomonas sp. ES6 TaxID=3039384 RepID=UPI0024B7BAEA|nr:hypothetical protein [Cellulomonas sp. ES6]WHP19576.1 hypothetical protein P9841_09455 [Cellulomonas sp. ES6]
MRAAGLVELEGGRDGRDDPGGRDDPAALLEPRVVVGGDPGERGDLLAAQARDAAHAVVRRERALPAATATSVSSEKSRRGSAASVSRGELRRLGEPTPCGTSVRDSAGRTRSRATEPRRRTSRGARALGTIYDAHLEVILGELS